MSEGKSVAPAVTPALRQMRETHGAVWKDVHIACRAVKRVLLWGPPGTGKSFIGTRVAPGTSLSRLYLTMDTPAAEVRGHYLPNENGSFTWHDGPGIHAWRTGGRLVIDEIDAASGDTLTLLLGLLDDTESAELTLPTNERVKPAASFSCVATTNQNPGVLPEALLDRFDAIFNITKPAPEAFDESIWSSPRLARVAEECIYLNNAPPRGKGDRPIGLRAFRAMDRLVGAQLHLDDAARLVIGPQASSWLTTAMRIAEPSGGSSQGGA